MKREADQVERSFVIAPESRLGPLTDSERLAVIKRSTIYGYYEKVLDRESAYEKLRASAEKAIADAQTTGQNTAAKKQTADQGNVVGGLSEIIFGRTGPRGGKTEGIVQAAAKSAAVPSVICREGRLSGASLVPFLQFAPVTLSEDAPDNRKLVLVEHSPYFCMKNSWDCPVFKAMIHPGTRPSSC